MKHAPLVAATLLMAAPVPGQDLELTLRGGSIPGSITWELSGGVPAAQGGGVLVSAFPGPSPLAQLRPNDPRQVWVDLNRLAFIEGALFDANGRVVLPTLTVPNQPLFVGIRIFYHGFSVPGTPLLIDKLSQPRAVRLRLANQFHTTNPGFLGARSFFPVIPLPDGRVMLIAGGQGAILAQVAQKSTQIYDPILDRFSTGPELNTERSLHTATALSDGRHLIVGGVDFFNDPQNTAELFDPANGFVVAADLGIKRMGHTATLLPDGRVLVTGGLQDMNAPITPFDPILSATGTTEIYNPAIDRWLPGPAMTEPRVGHAAIPYTDSGGNRKILLVGGLGVAGLLPTVLTSTDVYDPTTGLIAPGPTLGSPRGLFSVAPLPSGELLIAGGLSTVTLIPPGVIPTASAEIFDPLTGMFRSAASMTGARAIHMAFSLDDGSVLQVGGAIGSITSPTPLQTCERFDPSTNQWSPAPNMSVPRAAYGGYVTATGQVHILGGSTGIGGVTNSNEFFYR